MNPDKLGLKELTLGLERKRLWEHLVFMARGDGCVGACSRFWRGQ